ncbi:MAG: hypothetical protein IJ622_00005, partial [Bacteroidales bacterium]|nr:hypothetical protein [Bacteroidales bacterium]
MQKTSDRYENKPHPKKNLDYFTDFINAIIKTPEVSETAAFVPTMMNDLECANPLSGIPIIAAPTANNMGSANFSYPINIPNGRAGMQPQLSVTYNNNGGTGWMGEGWDLSVSCISIDTRWGVPRFDNRKKSEVYMLDGKQLVTRGTAGFMQPLPYQGEWVNRYQSPKQFYMRVEGGFQKIMRYGNDPTNYYWKVTDKDGTVYYYGKPVDDDGVNGAGHVVKMEDESGYAKYSYDAMGNVSENCRTFVLPAEDNAYTFIMNTEYDTWGRTLSITYPDKERVSYAYGLGGELKSVASSKNGNDKSLVD